MPLLGTKFPEMEVQTTHGKMTLPGRIAGKWFVLFSHPGDFTPVCTTEFVAFAKMHEDFRKLNCELIGLSIDQVFSHIKWVEWIKEKLGVQVTFPVIADGSATGREQARDDTPGQGHEHRQGGVLRRPERPHEADDVLPAGDRQEHGRDPEGREGAEDLGREQGRDARELAQERLPGRQGHHPARDGREDRSGAREAVECYDWWFCTKKL